MLSTRIFIWCVVIIITKISIKHFIGVVSTGHPPGNNTPIWIDGVNCLPDTNTILQCDLAGDITSCTHDQDAGVSCFGICTIHVCRVLSLYIIDSCTDGEFRVDSAQLNEIIGLLQICFNNEWFSICEESFQSGDATLVCNDLVTSGV